MIIMTFPNQEIQTKAIESAMDLNNYDVEELTPPDVVDELLNSNEDFNEWFQKVLKHCAEITIGKMEDLVFEANQTK